MEDNHNDDSKARNWPQILAILSISISSMTYGMLFTWPSPAIPMLTSPEGEYRFTMEECSYLPVISAATSMIATPIFGKMIDKIGRKYTVLSMAFSQSSAFLLAAFAKNIYVFYLSRIFSGLSDACVYVAIPMYIGEISTPKVRADWGNTYCFLGYFGQVVVSAIAGYNNVRTGALLCLTFPLLFAVTFAFVPESPFYLVMKEKQSEARKALQGLMRLKNVDADMKQLEADVQRQMSENGTWKELFTIRSNRRALYAGLFLRSAQQFSGLTVWGVYAEYIFKQSGGNMSPTVASICFFSACALGSLFAGIFFYRIGEKRSVKYSSSLSAAVLLVVGIYFYISIECPSIDLSQFKWVPLVGMLVYVPVFSIGLGIAPMVMLSELYSASIKSKALCVLTIYFGFLQCTITKLFQVLEVNFGMYTPFGLFAAATFGSTFLVDYFVPETRGKTLEEIQQEFKSSKKTTKS